MGYDVVSDGEYLTMFRWKFLPPFSRYKKSSRMSVTIYQTARPRVKDKYISLFLIRQKRPRHLAGLETQSELRTTRALMSVFKSVLPALLKSRSS